MTAGMKRRDWRRGVIALLAIYVLVLQTTLTALASGLAAQPDPFAAHPLCAPGQTAPAGPAQPDGKTGLPACCAALCLSMSVAAPPPAAPGTVELPAPGFAVVSHVPAARTVLAASLTYPLGARAPPFLT